MILRKNQLPHRCMMMTVSSTTDGIKKKLIKQFYLWDGDPVINPDGSVTSPEGKTMRVNLQRGRYRFESND